MLLRLSALIAVIVGILSFFMAPNAAAFGQTGHRVIGQIAQWHLTDTTANAIAELLGEDSLAEVSTWADEMRSNPEHFWQKVSPRWHYISLESWSDFKADSFNGEITDIYTGMRQSIAILSDPKSTSEDKAFYLKFLVHLVGDVHMPLHVGRAADKGGNTIDVNFFGDTMNLHTLWDSALIDAQKLSFTEFAQFINSRDPKHISTTLNSSPQEWVKESFSLRGPIYEVGDGKFSWQYQYQHMPTMKSQLQKAGIRLAGLLNTIFDPSAVPGVNALNTTTH